MVSPSVAGGWCSQREPRSSAHPSPCLALCITPIGLFLDCPLLVQLSRSVAQSRPTLCDPMDSMPGLPVHHQLPELAQTHVQTVSDTIQPFHPLSSPSHPIFNRSSIRVFSNESVLCIGWSEYWSFSFSISPSSEYSGLISLRINWLDLFAVQGTLKSLLQHHSATHLPVQET